MIVLVQSLSTSQLPDHSKNNTIQNFNNAFIGYGSITMPILYKKSEDIKSQLNSFFSTLNKKMCIENETAVIEFLLNLSKDIDELIEPFLFINKTVKGAFSDKIKIFVQKYDDPKTEGSFYICSTT